MSKKSTMIGPNGLVTLTEFKNSVWDTSVKPQVMRCTKCRAIFDLSFMEKSHPDSALTVLAFLREHDTCKGAN